MVINQQENPAPKVVAKSIKPLFRWVGGKQKLLKQILPHLPEKYGTYFEPFFGGGALFFTLNPPKAVLGDKNPEITNYLQVVRDNPGALIRALSSYTNSSASFYAARAAQPTSSIQRAARFQYLVNLGFGGVYRVNKQGRFNVPYSKESDREFFNGEQIWIANKVLAGTKITCGNFDETVKDAKKGDLVYFDPPYTVAHDNNGFLEYNEQIFQWDEQVKLARLAKSLAAQGVTVVVSNANHSSVKALYDTNKTFYISRKSTIAAENQHRGTVTEILVVYK